MDVDRLIESLRSSRTISETDLSCLFRVAAEIVFQEGTVVTVASPISVCGDIHGQFYDLLTLFEIGGDPGDVRYLFLGDYVDRGHYSIATFALLLAYKVKYPGNFFLIRGNHECRQVNHMYGFYQEIVQTFGHPGPYLMFNELFDLLPMSAVIDGKTFCVHGGLSPGIRMLEQIAKRDRGCEFPSSDMLADLYWSDPDDIEEWGENQRGAGYRFGRRPTAEFCHNNRLKMIARAHQLAMEGFQWHFDNHQLVTVWSAPNYMYRSGNKASIMSVDENLECEFKVFNAVQEQEEPEGACPYYFA